MPVKTLNSRSLNIMCCVFWPATHRKRWKTLENDHAHKRLMWDSWRKMKKKVAKFQMSNQCLGVNQLLGVTPNRWPTNFFLRFSSCVSHEPLVRMMEKVLFSWFFNVFYCFRPCDVHAFAGRNTQQLCFCLCSNIMFQIERAAPPLLWQIKLWQLGRSWAAEVAEVAEVSLFQVAEALSNIC